MRKTKHRIEVDPEPGFYETRQMIAISESLRQEIEQLKTELAETRGRLMVDRWLLTRRSDDIDNGLRDMLAPTIEFLKRVQVVTVGITNQCNPEARKEISRLRDLVK